MAAVPCPADDAGARFTSVLGARLNVGTLNEVEARLGRTRLIELTDADDYEARVCYLGSNGVVSFISGVPRLELSGFEVREPGTVAADGCRELHGRYATAASQLGGLHLGMSKADFVALLGDPVQWDGDSAEREYDSEQKMTPADRNGDVCRRTAGRVPGVEGGFGLSFWRTGALLLLIAALAFVTYAMVPSEAPPQVQADRIVIEKGQRRLTLYRDGVAVRSYRIALGPQPTGAKDREGDGRTPEGVYSIDRRNTASAYHLALHVSYPDARDRARAAALGVSPGGDIMIHGIHKGLGWLGPLHHLKDWTRGCIAVTDAEIDEIAKAAPDGTVVDIRP
jgi:hypothetical protein